MDMVSKPSVAIARLKRKRKSKSKFSASEHKNIKLDTTGTTHLIPAKPPNSPKSTVLNGKSDEAIAQFGDKYPILKDHELIKKFLNVQITNNQKGRIRQAVRDSLQGTSNVLVPDIIHNKIQSIIKNSTILTDSELRRIRILYNFLQTALKGEKIVSDTVPPKKEKPKKKNDGDSPKVKEKEKDGEKKEKKEQLVKKIKGPKRYVVFLGNLPLDINKEKILKHFSEMNEHIIDIRFPKNAEQKKSAIAYLELSNEPSYEFALSKHHSMLGSKRINVLYTAPKKGKVSKADAKSKSAKLIALQKSGKLVGSIPLAKKRSQRRLKAKQAQAKLEAENAKLVP